MARQDAVVCTGEKGARAQGLALLTACPAPPVRELAARLASVDGKVPFTYWRCKELPCITSLAALWLVPAPASRSAGRLPRHVMGWCCGCGWRRLRPRCRVAAGARVQRRCRRPAEARRAGAVR